MRSLILDDFANQPLTKRFLWQTMTALAWGFWIYLWSPLILMATDYLTITKGLSNSEGGRMLQVLISTLGGHLSMVSVSISIFIAWALLSNLGSHKVCRKRQKQPFMPQSLIRLSEATHYQQKQRMVAFHDEHSGQLEGIEVEVTPEITNFRTSKVFSVPDEIMLPSKLQTDARTEGMPTITSRLN